MSHASSDSAAVPAPRWTRLILLIAALIELSQGLGNLPILTGDLNAIPGPGLEGKIIIATIVVSPIAAAAALFFVLRDRLPAALVSMAIVILAGWMNYLPSVRLHGLELRDASGAFTGDWASTLGLVMEICVAPALALAVAALALSEKKLTLASVLAIVPTFFSVAMVIAFGISVMIYGF